MATSLGAHAVPKWCGALPCQCWDTATHFCIGATRFMYCRHHLPTICCRVLNEDPTDSGYLASVCLAVSRRLWLSAGKNGMRFVCCLSPASLLCKSPRPLRPPGTCALQSADLERSVAYWADALGFLEVDRGDDFAVMSAGERCCSVVVSGIRWVALPCEREHVGSLSFWQRCSCQLRQAGFVALQPLPCNSSCVQVRARPRYG